jgi:universal stress protein A
MEWTLLHKDTSMIPQHFLVPIDFSEYSTEALEYAIELAGKLQARITLLHVIQSLPMGGADMGVALPYSYIQELEAELNSSMEGYLKRVTDAGLQGDVSIVHGVPFQEILDTATMRHADLIIMGTHGRTGLRHVLLGSVAEKVMRLAACPVLVTRRPTDVPTQ